MSLFSRLSNISRKQKLELFYKLMNPNSNNIILDIGAEINPKGDRLVQLIDSYPWKEKITAVNISNQHIQFIKESYPEINTVVGNACNLNWPDKYFDIIYSNAVIEHVGSLENQKQFASEIMRVGKKWFVTTPNRWYPFEFHSRLPFVTWLPKHGYLWASKVLDYNHTNKKYEFFSKNNRNLRLMSVKELKQCFPGSRIIKQRITFLPETLIAYGGVGIGMPPKNFNIANYRASG